MSSLQNGKCLIVGLGNPGSVYDQTRHNIGFRVLEAFAKKQGWKLRSEAQFFGQIAQGVCEDKKVILLLPQTYMNSSGESVRKCADYLEVANEKVLIICDDIALPFGQLRLKAKGSAGGHNGLKSVEVHLGTLDYPRLRIGVGDRMHGELADHVLGKFTEEERVKLPSIEEKALASLNIWIKEGVDSAMRFANQIGDTGE